MTPPTVMFVTFDVVLEDYGGVGVPGSVAAPADRTGDPERHTTGSRLDVDAEGNRPQIPGTSLAGGLRDRIASRYGDEQARHWFGSIRSDRAGTGEGATAPADDAPDRGSVNDLRETLRRVDADASPLWVFDAVASGTTATETLVSTAVDRESGSARNRTLRAEQVAPPGTRFGAVLRWDGADEAERTALLAAIAGWRPLIGRGVSRGRGRCRVENLRHGTCDLGTTSGLRQWLTLDGTRLAADVAREPWQGEVAQEETPAELCRIRWTIAGPVHVGTGAPRRQDGHDPQVVRRGPAGPLVPGTAFKGLLRSRTEFILRSVGVNPSPCLDASCGDCLPCRLFGYTTRRPAGDGSVGRRGVLRVLDAPIRTSTPVRHREHVAIDRFTGGARDKLLFTMEAVEEGTVDLVIEDLGCDHDLQELAKALIRLVVDDIRDGYVGVGAATTRGYGALACDAQIPELPTPEEARATLRRLERDDVEGDDVAGDAHD